MQFGKDFFDDGLRRLGTRCEKWDMMQEEYGENLLPLWVADMDFPSPPAVQQALLHRAFSEPDFAASLSESCAAEFDGHAADRICKLLWEII